MFALQILADVESMRRRFEEARALVAEGDALARELGTPSMRQVPADIELLAGDAAKAEALLREELDELERIGDFGHYVSVVPVFVDALLLQGRGQEAQRELEICVRYTIDDDTDAQIGLCKSQAALLLIDGDLVRAEERARAAVTIAAGTDYRLRSIEALSRLAEVLVAAGRLSGGARGSRPSDRPRAREGERRARADPVREARRADRSAAGDGLNDADRLAACERGLRRPRRRGCRCRPRRR